MQNKGKNKVKKYYTKKIIASIIGLCFCSALTIILLKSPFHFGILNYFGAICTFAIATFSGCFLILNSCEILKEKRQEKQIHLKDNAQQNANQNQNTLTKTNKFSQSPSFQQNSNQINAYKLNSQTTNCSFAQQQNLTSQTTQELEEQQK